MPATTSPREADCRECDGTGTFSKGLEPSPCPWCDSTGRVEIVYVVRTHGHNGDQSFSEVWDVVLDLDRARALAERIVKTDRYRNVLEDGTPTVQWVEIQGDEFEESLGYEEHDGEYVWTGC